MNEYGGWLLLFACQIWRWLISANLSLASWNDIWVRTLSGWGLIGWPSMIFSSSMLAGRAVLTAVSLTPQALTLIRLDTASIVVARGERPVEEDQVPPDTATDLALNQALPAALPHWQWAAVDTLLLGAKTRQPQPLGGLDRSSQQRPGGICPVAVILTLVCVIASPHGSPSAPS